MGRTRFLCSYSGCKTCSPNMRFNIERHVWTQHVRRTVPGMNQCNYVARLHKVYVHRYVVMADEAQPMFSFPDDQYDDSFLQQQPPTPRTISSFGRLVNDNYFNGVLSQPTSEGAVSDGQIAVFGSFERLAGMLNNENDHAQRPNCLACETTPNEREKRNSLESVKSENYNTRTRVCELPAMPVGQGSDRLWMMNGDDANEQSYRNRNARANGETIKQNEFLNQNGPELCRTPSLAHSKENVDCNDTSAGLEPYFSVAVPRFPAQNQQPWCGRGQLKMQTAGAWPEHNYYLTLAGEQEAGNGDVWRPVNF